MSAAWEIAVVAGLGYLGAGAWVLSRRRAAVRALRPLRVPNNDEPAAQ